MIVMQICPSDWLTLLWSPQQHIFCKGFLVKAKMLHSSKWGYFTVENEIQLQLESKSVRNISIIFFRNHMMTAVRHESEGMVLFEGKGRNSLSNRCLPSTSYMCNSTIWIFFVKMGSDRDDCHKLLCIIVLQVSRKKLTLLTNQSM